MSSYFTKNKVQWGERKGRDNIVPQSETAPVHHRPATPSSYVERTGDAAAVVLGDQIGVVVGVYGVVVAQLDHLLESVVDEDEADEGGEAFLGEAREVLHQEAGVRGDQHQAEETRPEADPQAELEVVEAVVSEGKIRHRGVG